jgi:23S rRNA (pseudouridine1915-N3)-methyltransferase
VRIRVIAVGTRMPEWVDQGCEEYLRRLRSSMPVTLQEIPLARRSSSATPAQAIATETRAVLAKLGEDEVVVALDERGKQWTTLELAEWLGARQHEGADLAFVIGGPDGHGPALLERAQHRWSLSRLTLPHALVRVLLAEQLYRASTVLAGHPYHRQ